jgi:hypothetical protein
MLEEFLKSGYGRIFLEQQLPGIINGMTALATEMKRANDLKEKELKISQSAQAQSLAALNVAASGAIVHPNFTRKGSQTRNKADGSTYMVEVIEDHLGQEYTRFLNTPGNTTVQSGSRPQRRP